MEQLTYLTTLEGSQGRGTVKEVFPFPVESVFRCIQYTWSLAGGMATLRTLRRQAGMIAQRWK